MATQLFEGPAAVSQTVDAQYLELVDEILRLGEPGSGGFRQDRTGVGTYSVFGRQLRFDLRQGFPLLTTKKLHLRSIIHELLWFLRGETNVAPLREQKVTIWDEWADAQGELGSVYGKQWRRWQRADGSTVDQIADLVRNIRNNPTSRRLLVVSYNPGDLPPVAPPACHTLFQVYVSEGRMSLQLYQRSADLMLGVPFNIASYSLLLMMLAQVTGYEAYEFVHTFGDVHIYSNHIEGAKTQLARPPRPLPRMSLNPAVKELFDFRFEDFTLEGYEPHPHIKLEIAV